MKAKRPILRWIESNKSSIIKVEAQGGYTVLHYEDNTNEIVSYPNKLIMPLLDDMIYIKRKVFVRKELLNTNELSRRIKRKYKMKNLLLLILTLFVLSSSKPAMPVTTLPVVSVTTNTTLTNANHVVICKGGAITLTLPSASANTGLVLIVANHGTGAVTFSPSVKVGNTDMINSITYQLGGNLVTVISDGTDWRLIGQ